ncbi:uncharacterized protein JCM6883_006112 [Sporobolomyces salmoneus]|uniref:uncharacterized protein n=1 Tax=Sporobolomyces salmoneus TaxID=183962 RepID=UPI003179798B
MSTADGEDNPRRAAIAMLKRAASTRELSSTSNPPSPVSSSSPAPRREHRSRPRAYTAHSRQPTPNDDDSRSLYPPGQSSLERTASLLARQLAMAKLTGTAPPTPPPTFFTANEPLPTLEDLQRRARAKMDLTRGAGLRRNNTTAAALSQAGQPGKLATPPVLKRNNTVTGIGLTGGFGTAASTEIAESLELAQSHHFLGPHRAEEDEQPQERSEARINLMRKLSARRLATPAGSVGGKDKLGVVGRIGRARPRSGSVGGIDWRLGHGSGFDSVREEETRESIPQALPSAHPLQLGLPLNMSYSSEHQGRNESGSGIGMGIRMDGDVTDQSDTSSRPESTTEEGGGAGWKDPNEPSTDEGEQSEDERNVWEYDAALQPSSNLRPDSEMEHIRESKQHLPPPIQTNSLQSSPHPSFRSFHSAQSQLNDQTPKAPWAPSFLATAPHTSSPSSATTIQQPRFSNPPLQQLTDDSVSPNSSPQYPSSDWPTHEDSEGTRPTPSTDNRHPSEAHLELPTPLSSASISPSASASSTASSTPSFEDAPPQRSNERTQRPIPTFGIAAVEAQPSGFFGLPGGIGSDRKRGSSASSSLALLEASRRARERGSDATQLQLGSNFARSRMGSAVSSIDSSGSGSGSGRMLEKVDARVEEEQESLEGERGDGKLQDEAKVDENPSFPSPQADYQFPFGAKAHSQVGGHKESTRSAQPEYVVSSFHDLIVIDLF